MIVVLKRGAEQDKREQLINWLKNQGLGVHISEGEYQTVLGLVGDTSRIDMQPQVPSRRHDRAGGRRQGRRRKLLHDRGPVLGRIRRADRRGRQGREGLGREHAARRRIQAPHFSL